MSGFDKNKLGLDLDLLKKGKTETEIAEMKEKMYDNYDSQSSRRKTMAELGSGRGEVPAFGGTPAMASGKPSFKLNMAGLVGAGGSPAADIGADLEKEISGSLSKRGLTGITPSAAASGGNMFKGIDALQDARGGMDRASMLSGASPMGTTSMLSKNFKSRMKMQGIPTPLGSNMSRAKFDFSGYDPLERKRKKVIEVPPRPIAKKEEEDCEVLVTDVAGEPEGFGDLEAKNAKDSFYVLGRAKADIYDARMHQDEINKVAQSARGEQVDTEFEVLKL